MALTCAQKIFIYSNVCQSNELLCHKETTVENFVFYRCGIETGYYKTISN
jgi:hypothetical protein